MKKQTLITVLKETAETLRGIKFNPYHDSLGRFGTGGGGPKLAPDTGGGTGGTRSNIVELEQKQISDELEDQTDEWEEMLFEDARKANLKHGVPTMAESINKWVGIVELLENI